jgi:UDP-N-acetylmuramyl pentapeptide phosphotransferase/UDP-N-acetylglucosamine-1-phosphate transferase
MSNIGSLLGLAVSFLCSVGLVVTTKWHGKFSMDGMVGVQKFHVVPTPRIGGVAVMLGLVAAWLVSSGPVSALLGSILVASLPAFCFGLAEDMTKRVSVRMRLLATMASGVFAWYLTGASVEHIGVAPFDTLLSIVPVAVMFTAFAVGGVANSVNIIDGFNGLASGTVMLSLGTLGAIALNAGDVELGTICITVCAVTFGFFLVNFPFGKLFLGDGGAYLLGFLLAWLAVMLCDRNPMVSPWAPMVACAYPIFETIFTIVRRVWARSHPGLPDSSHLHSLIKVGVVVRWFPRMRLDLRNALVSPFSWAIAAVPAALSVTFAQHTLALFASWVLSFMLYLAVYRYVYHASRSRLKPVKSVTPKLDANNDEVFPIRRIS